LKYLESELFLRDFTNECLGLLKVKPEHLDIYYIHPSTKHILHINMDFGTFLEIVKHMSPGDIVLILPMDLFGYFHVPPEFTYKKFAEWAKGQLGYEV
jgi:hypothetical protein